MKRIVAIVLVVALVVASVVGVILLAVDDGPTAASIGDSSISREAVDDELQVLAENATLQRAIERAGAPAVSNQDGSVTAEIGAGWLSLLVTQKLAEQEVDRRGLEPTKADEKRARTLAVQSVGGVNVFNDLPEWMRDRLLDRWTNVAILEHELIDEPSPALQQAVAEQCPSGRYVSHILVESGVEAQAVLQELAGGGDFADVAERESFDQGSAEQGGSLGCIDGQDFIEPFATVAATQPIGEVSEPFATDFGTHIVLVSDEPPASTLASAALEQVLNRARGEDVELNDRYGNWDKRNGQVVPSGIPAQAPAAAPSG
jgi:hypothetical protein